MNQEIYDAYVDTGANQLGGELPYFVGKQYGGASSWLGSLVKMAFPILIKKLLGLGRSVADDVITRKKTIGESIKDHAMQTVQGFARSNEVLDEQKGSSINRRGKKRKAKPLSSSFPLFAKRHRKK